MEIERKYLLKDPENFWYKGYNHKRIVDQYVSKNVRFRNIDDNSMWLCTIKGEGTLSRTEYELPILVKPSFNILDYPLLKKTRYIVPYENQNFEINVFDNILYKDKKLCLVELELFSENQDIYKPDWLGPEVTENTIFYGYNLWLLLKFKNSELKLV